MEELKVFFLLFFFIDILPIFIAFILTIILGKIDKSEDFW